MKQKPAVNAAWKRKLTMVAARMNTNSLKVLQTKKITESAFNEIQLLAAVLPASFVEVKHVVLPCITEENPTGHAPPLHHGVSIYILTCDYRI